LKKKNKKKRAESMPKQDLNPGPMHANPAP